MSTQDVIQILGKAILDPAFHARLLSDPEWALNQFSLTGSERAAIKNIQPDQLQALVDQFKQSGLGAEHVDKVFGDDFLAKIQGDVNGDLPEPHWQPDGEQAVSEAHNQPGGIDEPVDIPFDNHGGPSPHMKPGGSRGIWVQRLILPALGLAVIGVLLFGSPDTVGGLLGPLDAIGCTGVENAEQQGQYSSPGVTLVSYSLQTPMPDNSMAGFFDALNGLRSAVGQPPVLFDVDCSQGNLGPFPPGIDLDSSCGDGVRDQGEQCDGTNLTQCLQGQVCNSCQCVTQIQAPAPDARCECQGVDLHCSDGSVQFNVVECQGSGVCQCREPNKTLACPDGTYADFNPQCGTGGDACANSTCGDGVCNGTCGEDTSTCSQDCHL